MLLSVKKKTPGFFQSVCCAALHVLSLTKEAVDDSKQATHGADDGRDDIILPLYLQSAGIDLGPARPRGCRAQPCGICHPGWRLEVQLVDVQQLEVAPSHRVQLIQLTVGGDDNTETLSLTCCSMVNRGRGKCKMWSSIK